MEVRGPLMAEHRVIERVVGAMRVQLDFLAAGGGVDTRLIEDCIDFLRIYADRTHHGKEEDILFRWLSNRPLSLQHRVVLEDLLDDHALSRETTSRLADATRLHRDGDRSSTTVIRDSLQILVDLYPRHIAREDKVFFPAVVEYVNAAEEQAILAEFGEFDRHMIHEKYRSVAKSLAERRPAEQD